jgi:hypothetical protein
MKRLVLASIVALLFLSAAAAAPSSGIGVFLGQPTGLSYGMDISSTTWLDFKAAWNFATAKDGFSVILQGNYELAFPGSFVIEGQDIVPFIGVGAEAAIGDDLPQLGLRIPFGLNYRFAKAPLELFLELGVGLYLFPSTSFMGSGGLGLRFRF